MANNVVRATLLSSPVAVCGTGNLGHVGQFRMKARVWASAAGQYIRLAWSDGDGPFRANAYVSPPVAGAFSEIDLGLVSISPKQLGTQKWSGRIEAYTTGAAGTDTLDVDYLVLVPAGEGYGRARAQVVADTPTVFSARDEFNQTAGVLTGKTAPLGGVWTGGGDADDFSVETTGMTAERTVAVNDVSNGRMMWVPTSMTNCAVQTDVKTTLTTGYNERLAVIARTVNATNFLRAYLRWNGSISQFVVQKNIAGVLTSLANVTFGLLNFNAWYSIRLVVDTSGRWWAGYAEKGQPINLTYAGQDTDLATGGTLASGFPGISEDKGSNVAATRSWDNFMAWVPTVPTVLYSGRVAEVRHDGAIRQDSTGVYYGPVPAYRGSRFLVPPAGDENRTSRILVKAHRNDIEAEASDVVTDNLTIQTIITPRYVVVPF